MTENTRTRSPFVDLPFSFVHGVLGRSAGIEFSSRLKCLRRDYSS